jgi:hypothetical protein
MGGDTTVNRMGIRGVLNGPVDRHPPGIDSFRTEGVSLYIADVVVFHKT